MTVTHRLSRRRLAGGDMGEGVAVEEQVSHAFSHSSKVKEGEAERQRDEESSSLALLRRIVTRWRRHGQRNLQCIGLIPEDGGVRVVDLHVEEGCFVQVDRRRRAHVTVPRPPSTGPPLLHKINENGTHDHHEVATIV